MAMTWPSKVFLLRLVADDVKKRGRMRRRGLPFYPHPVARVTQGCCDPDAQEVVDRGTKSSGESCKTSCSVTYAAWLW